MIDTQTEDWLKELLPNVADLARVAGDEIMSIYSEMNPAVEYKRDNSPLTQADLASHSVILDGLFRLTPEWPILSEESQEIPYAQRESWRYFWLVDPLDGTKEFLRRNGEFTVNIALVEGCAPILGVVYAPAVDRLYFASKGSGAYKSDKGIVSKISTAMARSGAKRVVVSHSHGSDEASLERYTGGTESSEFVPMGSSLKFCLVAEGVADVYPRTGPTMEWDTAAAHCVLDQAGGTVTDLSGTVLKYNKRELLNNGFVAFAL